MSIDIVDNFWDNVKNNEALIKRCFMHHFNRHPDPEGVELSYNNLVMKMHEYNVFGRFDLRKLVVASGISVALSDDPEKALEDAGVNVNKKWEQFIYKWIEKIINEEYNKNGKLSRTFIHNDTLIDYGIPEREKVSWITDPQEAEAYEAKFQSYTSDRRGRKFAPTFRDHSRYSEGEFDSPEDVAEASDLREYIMSKLTGRYLLDVFLLMEKGYSRGPIAKEIGFSPEYVRRMMNKVREIVGRACLA